MKKMIILLLSLFVASSALAVVDEDPNMLGIYFDLSADTPCIEGVAPYDQMPGYVILTNPTPESIGGYEFGYLVEGNAIILGVVMEGTALDVGGAGNHIVGLGEPLMTSETTLLATMTVLYTDTTMAPVLFTLSGTQPSSIDPMLPTILYGDGVLMTLGTSSLPGTPCALINGICDDVVTTENTTFDSFKSLYR